MPAALTEANLNDPITLHLRNDFTRLLSHHTVGEALAWLRRYPPAGRILYFYVVDDAGRLLGVVPTRRLVLSPPEQPVAEIMVRSVLAVPAAATVLDACEFFIQHRLLALPVVDENRVLLGQIDVDLYTDELTHLHRADARDDLFQLIGVHVSVARPQSPWAGFRTRFPWLLCNILGGLIAAVLAQTFDDVVAVVAVSLFIPVVLSLAESIAIQSVSLAVQSLHGQPPTWAAVLPRIRQEAATGGLIGGACASVVALVALLWLRRPAVALSLFGGICAGMTCSAAIGLAVPYLLRLLRRDPRVAAGPVALVAADLATLGLYFSLARALVE